MTQNDRNHLSFAAALLRRLLGFINYLSRMHLKCINLIWQLISQPFNFVGHRF
jgi:hypothetical protein